MPDIVAARALVLETAARAGYDIAVIDRIFEHAPLDFPIIISNSLPFFAHQLGMAGITLRGRVHLLKSILLHSPADIIVLIRHEAEHVRQQRERGLAFYPRYVYDWIGGFLGNLSAAPGSRWYRAYLNISYEREAYSAGKCARMLLDRK